MEKNKKLTEKQKEIFAEGVKVGLTLSAKATVDILHKIFPSETAKEVAKP